MVSDLFSNGSEVKINERDIIKCGKMLEVSESAWRAYGNSLYYPYNFSVNIKLFQNKSLKSPWESTWCWKTKAVWNQKCYGWENGAGMLPGGGHHHSVLHGFTPLQDQVRLGIDHWIWQHGGLTGVGSRKNEKMGTEQAVTI